MNVLTDPQHFASMINVAYIIAFSVSLIFAVLGYVMRVHFSFSSYFTGGLMSGSWKCTGLVMEFLQRLRKTYRKLWDTRLL